MARHQGRAPRPGGWAVVWAEDGAFVGEAVLSEVDFDNESANYRVWLAGPQVFGQGYGTEITQLVRGDAR